MSTTKMRLPAGLLTLVAFVTLPACGKQVMTAPLGPSQVKAFSFSSEVREFCPNSEFGPLSPLETLVGYSNWELGPGTACRGFVMFDLSSLLSTNVLAATLAWGNTTKRKEGAISANDPPCLASMFVANEPWTTFDISGEQLTVTNFNKPIGVGTVVRDWVQGKRPNHGFFFVGPEEKISNAKNNNLCFTRMGNFKLEVVIAVDPGASSWPQ